MTARLTDEERKERNRASKRRYYQRHKDDIKANRREYYRANYEKNKALRRAQRKAWYAGLTAEAKQRRTDAIRLRERNDPQKSRARAMRYYLANRETVLGKQNERSRNLAETLADKYVRKLLSLRSNLPPTMWPESVVELKRAQLKLIRYVKTQRCE